MAEIQVTKILLKISTIFLMALVIGWFVYFWNFKPDMWIRGMVGALFGLLALTMELIFLFSDILRKVPAWIISFVLNLCNFVLAGMAIKPITDNHAEYYFLFFSFLLFGFMMYTAIKMAELKKKIQDQETSVNNTPPPNGNI